MNDEFENGMNKEEKAVSEFSDFAEEINAGKDAFNVVEEKTEDIPFKKPDAAFEQKPEEQKEVIPDFQPPYQQPEQNFKQNDVFSGEYHFNRSQQYSAQPEQNGYRAPEQNDYRAPEQNDYRAPEQNGYKAPEQNGYGQPGQNGYGQQEKSGYNPNFGGYRQPSYSNYEPVQPQNSEQKKNNKGLKVFFISLAVIAGIALIIGVASVMKYVVRKDGNRNGSGENAIRDDVSLNINASPKSPEKISDGSPLSTTQIAAKVRACNVGIVVYTKNSSSAAGEGSGIVMGEDSTGDYTYIITCAHVIDDKGVKVKVQTEDGTSYDAEIVGADIRTDIGVLKIKAKGLQAAEFGDSTALQVGDPVYAVGNPGGVEFFGSFTGGYVAAIDRPISSEIGYTMKCIQHSSAISPGNSGGALANQFGQVIGINSQKIASSNYEGIGFAIPISSAKSVIDSLIKTGYVPNRPMLGITYYPLSASAQYSMIAQIKGLPAGTLIINDIGNDSSLSGTEARKYDMITKVNGKELTTADVLLELIDNGEVGDKLTLTLCRVNSNYTIDEFEVVATLVEDKGETIEQTTTFPYIDPFEYFENFGF